MGKALGICVGAGTIAVAARADDTITHCRTGHDGRVAEALRKAIGAEPLTALGVTGRKFRRLLDIPTVSEPEAVEYAYQHIRHHHPDLDCIVSVGAETFIAYMLDRKGRIRGVQTANKCASGTGEFFLQQIKRMELEVDEAVEIAAPSPPYPVAGRCSVFCKSDCTHALNKGVEKGRVAAGLCRMMAGKITELLKKANAGRAAIVGGVTRNRVVLDFVREIYPDIQVPREALYFEALGALLWAEEKGIRLESATQVVRPAYNSFGFLPDLKEAIGKVNFKEAPPGAFYEGDYVLGLDVGSTTTKAVLIRTDTFAVTASTYLRTNGNPVGASRHCYRKIVDQLPAGDFPSIIGIGVTGSGRHIAGLHAMTDGVVNEIVAHAAAALHYDPEVETIFEIGGQDAKYTFITNRVPCDYAMNEACSAGTGSFLEEACREALGIEMEEIAVIALRSSSPPNFNDQCAAFIGSDIKTAVQEDISREDIVAGLVYSVCQNYLNRVKGNRPVGKKIFLQGGVSYNQAVPVAMAALCQQEIIVPPEPGLMGAFGAAIEVHRKLVSGLLAPESFDLEKLAAREVSYGTSFTCNGTTSGCDRKCSIARVIIDGKTYPFGGACDRFYNFRRQQGVREEATDLVRLRETIIFEKYAPQVPSQGPEIGIIPSLFTNTYYPLYAHFFSNLGLRPILAAGPAPEGMEAVGSAFCYPVVLSHGFLKDLLGQEVRWIFIPHVKNTSLETSDETNCTCPFVQGEPYYLKASFHDDLAPRLVTAVLDFEHQDEIRKAFVAIGRQVGCGEGASRRAFDAAWEIFLRVRREMHDQGRRFLAALKPEETAIILFGRPYNAFSRFGNMGIPHKFASRGYKVIPYDFLPLEELGGSTVNGMYWTSGQGILQGARLIRQRQNLFGVYITNFSCGPDSFIIGFFRDIMGQKPSLTLELDAHTADAGVDTRIEAFLDIIRGYRELNLPEERQEEAPIARVLIRKGKIFLRAVSGKEFRLTDPEVHLVIPSMGDTASKAMAAAFRYSGVRATALPPPGPRELVVGKGEATCKECLPFFLTTGSFLKYLQEKRDENELTVYFMPDADGPCRFGQYNVFLDKYVRKQRLQNVALLSLSGENSYAGMPVSFTRRAWQGVAISDGLDDTHAGILTIADAPAQAMAVFEEVKGRILESIGSDGRSRLLDVIAEQMQRLSRLKKKYPLSEATKVTLAGEIYVRRDSFSRQYLVEQLAQKGVLVTASPLAEWVYYSDYCVMNGISTLSSFKERMSVRMKELFMRKDEAAIQERLALSGFFQPRHMNMQHLMSQGARLIHPQLSGEAILTVSTTLSQLGDDTHGVISIGPFGCMPCRIAESILNYRLQEEKEAFSARKDDFWSKNKHELPLPFLAIESDGNAFPQVVEARIESLVLAAHRLKMELQRGK